MHENRPYIPHRRLEQGRISLFLLLLAVLLAFSPLVSSVEAAPTVTQQYETTKQEMDSLRKNPQKRSQRDPWLKLAQTLLELHDKHPLWKNRPAALYRSALALDELARRSGQRSDGLEAVQRYERLHTLYPASVLADDALYNIARLKAECLDDIPGAREVMEKVPTLYPSGDRVQQAKRYAKALSGKAAQTKGTAAPGAKPSAPKPDANAPPASTVSFATPSTPEKPPFSGTTLKQISWQTRRNTVRISLDFDRPVVWKILSQPENKKNGSPDRLVVELADTAPDHEIRPGIKIPNSELKRVRVDLSYPGYTRLLLDFSELKRFTVKTEESPFRLVITTASKDSVLPKGTPMGDSLQSDTPIESELPFSLARQLGLTVGTVVLDPGHGGKDPGTSHHDVTESEITLDLVKRIGALLAAHGLNVLHTRSDDSWVALEARSRKANEIKADLMVSIHVNASPNTSTVGFETYYLDFASNAEAVRVAGVENAMNERKLGELEGILAELMLSTRTQESRRLAEQLQNATLTHLRKKDYDTRDGGIKSAPFHVLIGSNMPSVLVEVGYCSNQLEAIRIASPAYRAALAEGIANGILAYIGKFGTQ